MMSRHCRRFLNAYQKIIRIVPDVIARAPDQDTAVRNSIHPDGESYIPAQLLLGFASMRKNSTNFDVGTLRSAGHLGFTIPHSDIHPLTSDGRS